MTVKDLLDLVKEDGFLVEIDNTETDFQSVLDVAEAIWSYGGCPIQEIQSSMDSSTHLKIII
jgi:hypothetical protein